MEPSDAVKQLEYVFDANTDAVGGRCAPMYGQTFERVAEHGTGQDIATVAGELGARISDGRRPTADEANALAKDVLDRRALTDGGD